MLFQSNNYTVKMHFRFKWDDRWWEIDIIAYKAPLVFCVDCKHWHRGWRRSAIKKAVEAQVNRSKAFSSALSFLQEKMCLFNSKKVYLIPVILSLVQNPLKFHNSVPIVPILQLQNFLTEAPANVNSITHFFRHL